MVSVTGIVVGLAVAGSRGVLAVAAVAVAAGVVIALVVGSEPRRALAVLLLTTIVVEDDPAAFPSFGGHAYLPLPGLKVTILADALVLLLALAVVLSVGRQAGRLRLPTSLTGPLAVIALGGLVGAATGHFAAADPFELVSDAHGIVYLVLVPFLFVNAAEGRNELTFLLQTAAVLAVSKGVVGTFMHVLGMGRKIQGAVLTYYQPTTNWLLCLFLLGLLACLLLRIRVPLWAIWGSLPVLVTFIYSLRRSFWIATVLGAFVIVLVVGLHRGRLLLFLVVVLAALGLWATLVNRGPTENVVLERARSLTAGHIQQNREDRYRVAERRNALDELRRGPVLGLGLGVPWSITFPLPVEHEHGLFYVHFALLYFWLKLGVLGAIGYLWLMAAALRLALAIFRSHPDRLIRAGGLACLGGLLGLMLADTTATFTGSNLRLTLLLGCVLGWLSVAWEDSRRLNSSSPRTDRRLHRELTRAR